MSSFLELAKSRKSCRAYSPRPISRKDLELCAETALHSPSACNSQPWKFVIVDDREQKRRIASTFPTPGIAMNAFAREAAAFIAILSERQKTAPWIGGKLAKKDFRLMDIGIACAHIVLQAEELGIGTCILGWFDEKQIKNILDIPRNKRIELIVSLGYPAEGVPLREKNLKARSETLSFNRYI